MASPTKLPFLLFFPFSIFFVTIPTAADVICENLTVSSCAFAISSSGNRCVLENYKIGKGLLDYTCRTSEIVVDGLAGIIETDECVDDCGVDRRVVGISSDPFLSPHSMMKLCSPECYQNCPNIVDLYFNLAAGEGVFLPSLCTARKSRSIQEMLGLINSNGGGNPPEDSNSPAPASF